MPVCRAEVRGSVSAKMGTTDPPPPHSSTYVGGLEIFQCIAMTETFFSVCPRRLISRSSPILTVLWRRQKPVAVQWMGAFIFLETQFFFAKSLILFNRGGIPFTMEVKKCQVY